jgi:hypothetical protein
MHTRRPILHYRSRCLRRWLSNRMLMQVVATIIRRFVSMQHASQRQEIAISWAVNRELEWSPILGKPLAQGWSLVFKADPDGSHGVDTPLFTYCGDLLKNRRKR